MPLRHIPVGRPQGNIRTRDDAAQLLHYLAFPVLVTAFASLTGAGSPTLVQTVLSFVLLQIAWASWVSWKAKPPAEKDFPFFAIIAAMFWLAYGLPLFWSR